MMNFCKKTVHTFLGLNDHQDMESSRCCRNIPSLAGGLSFIAGDCPKPVNVLESAAVKPAARKKYSGGFGFLDDISGNGFNGMDGLSSCTESLGFESCDQMEEEIDESCRSRSMVRSRRLRKAMERVKRREEVKKFPPPLPSLNRNGQPCFFLKPVRKDGRLELTEVKINRPEILRASRHDGRLRLQLIRPEPEPEPHQEEEEKEQQAEEEEEEGKIVKRDEEKEEEETEDSVQQWQFPLTSRGDGFGRCHEHINHHHQFPLWNHHCVAIR